MSGELKRVAFHEAGHAVAHVRLCGGFSDMVCIGGGVADEGALGNAAQADPADGPNEEIISCLAGWAAELEIGIDAETARAGATSDVYRALATIDAWDDSDLDGWLLRSREWVRLPEQWRAIELIASELLLYRLLLADEVVILVDVADGETSPSDLERFRRDFGIEEIRSRMIKTRIDRRS